MATDELYLMAAECNVKLNKIQEGMGYLNNLLAKRWKTGTYIPITAGSQTDALNIISKERRKELLIRGIRWSDLKGTIVMVRILRLPELLMGKLILYRPMICDMRLLFLKILLC